MKRSPKLTKPAPAAEAGEELREFGVQSDAHPIMSDLYRRALARR